MHVDISKTKEYYHSITESPLCDCAYCRNYRLQIKSAFPKVAEYLDTLGIDIEKAFETSPLEPDESGMLEYCCCQYIAFGTCVPEYHHKIGNVEFRVATSYPSTGIEQEHFVIELFPVQLQYVPYIEFAKGDKGYESQSDSLRYICIGSLLFSGGNN